MPSNALSRARRNVQKSGTLRANLTETIAWPGNVRKSGTLRADLTETIAWPGNVRKSGTLRANLTETIAWPGTQACPLWASSRILSKRKNRIMRSETWSGADAPNEAPRPEKVLWTGQRLRKRARRQRVRELPSELRHMAVHVHAGTPESKMNGMKRQSPACLTCMQLSPLSQAVAKSGGDSEAGRALYHKGCGICHGATGQGNPAIMKASKGALRELSSQEIKSGAERAVSEGHCGRRRAERAGEALIGKGFGKG
jgi:mono/diheme cytochrome c family protein